MKTRRTLVIRRSLFALSASCLSVAALCQAMPAPEPSVRPAVAEPWMAQQQAQQTHEHAPVAEPWMAHPNQTAGPTGRGWQSPIAQSNRSPALEPVDLPPAIEQGIDMIYIDESLVPRAVHQKGFLAGITDAAWSAAPVDLFTSVNPIYTQLRRGLVKYQQTWGSLPQVRGGVRTNFKTRFDRRQGHDASNPSRTCRWKQL